MTNTAEDRSAHAPANDDEEVLVSPGVILEEVRARLWDIELTRAYVDIAEAGVGDGARKRDKSLLAPALSLWDEPDVEVIDLVDGLIPAEGLTVQSSDPKTGKTWIEEEIAVSIATGTPAFGTFRTMCGPVALFLFEDSRAATRTRLGAIATAKGLKRSEALADVHLVCRPFFDMLNAEDLAWVVASVRAMPVAPLALFFDPLRDAHTGDEVDDMDRVSRALRILVKVLHCAVFVTHHNRKGQNNGQSKGQPGDEMRGGGELRGRLDAGIYPKLTGGDQVTTFELLVKTDKRDGLKVAPFTLKLEIEDENKRARCVRWTVMKDGRESTATPEQRTLSALVLLNESSPCDYFASHTVARRAGMKSENTVTALGVLLSDGKVERGFGGKGWRITSGEIV